MKIHYRAHNGAPIAPVLCNIKPVRVLQNNFKDPF